VRYQTMTLSITLSDSNDSKPLLLNYWVVAGLDNVNFDKPQQWVKILDSEF